MRVRPAALIVTLGGTVEAVDAVRVLTNLSGGGLGREIVAAALARGLRVHALVSVLAAAPPPHRRLTVERFTSARDLGRRLRAQLQPRRAGAVAVAMAAAVADYRPARVTRGKLSSTPAARTLRLVRNPKLIDAIHRWRPDAVLVSFKLAAADTADGALLDLAHRQRLRTRSRAVVANRWPSGGVHRAWLVSAEGVQRLVGRRQIARAVVDVAMSRTGIAGGGRASVRGGGRR
ncbi:MAG: hypothetical protein IPH44_11520 [Myxococcales bacterium]|nr:hypothetical protein [Myxococcales bacterium]MBK7197019.1 hypothetical protein [Myxococcales bacterium]MBP6849296.1 hypothetical protein [Kofleriaceae bacterium]